MLLPPPRDTAASAFMATRLGGIRGSATAIRLLQSGLAASTANGYGNLFARFAEFCDEEGVSALPATTATVISYIGHLADLHPPRRLPVPVPLEIRRIAFSRSLAR